MLGWWHHLDIWRHVSCSQTPIWPTLFCRVNESPSCIPDLWERDHTFKFLCAMSNLSMLKKKGPKGIHDFEVIPTILKIYLIKITDLQPQNGHPCHSLKPQGYSTALSSTVPSLTVSCFAQATGCLWVPENFHPNSKCGKSVHWFTQTCIPQCCLANRLDDTRIFILCFDFENEYCLWWLYCIAIGLLPTTA